MNPLFQSLSDSVEREGPIPAAKKLVDSLRESGKFTELFEAMKMLHRLQIGLPAVAQESDPPLTADQIDAIERGLIDACREVGLGLLRRGRLQEGWMYMRPVGDKLAARAVLAELSVDSENLDEFLTVLVQEGVDIGRGVELTLQHRGTCNTITMLESIVAMRDRKDQQEGVGKLVRHVHEELIASLRQDLGRREGGRSLDAATLEEILSKNPGILRDGSYHLDTTHLAATVRFARVLDDKEELRLALDLCRYGRELHHQYQYPSEEPFGELYLMSGYFFGALLGIHVEPALRQFLQKAESLDTNEHGSVAIETYADLLARIGRPKEALQFLIQRMPPGMRPFGIAPSLLELSCQANDFSLMEKASEERGDIIGYAAALLQSKSLPRVS